jgi:hypothetical protein
MGSWYCFFLNNILQHNVPCRELQRNKNFRILVDKKSPLCYFLKGSLYICYGSIFCHYSGPAQYSYCTVVTCIRLYIYDYAYTIIPMWLCICNYVYTSIHIRILFDNSLMLTMEMLGITLESINKCYASGNRTLSVFFVDRKIPKMVSKSLLRDT